jgi:hypothetical protein
MSCGTRSPPRLLNTHRHLAADDNYLQPADTSLGEEKQHMYYRMLGFPTEVDCV